MKLSKVQLNANAQWHNTANESGSADTVFSMMLCGCLGIIESLLSNLYSLILSRYDFSPSFSVNLPDLDPFYHLPGKKNASLRALKIFSMFHFLSYHSYQYVQLIVNYINTYILLSIKILQVFSTVIIIINIYWAANQHIIMISEGSCDTEDLSNDAENTVLHHRNKLHFKMYLISKPLF